MPSPPPAHALKPVVSGSFSLEKESPSPTQSAEEKQHVARAIFSLDEVVVAAPKQPSVTHRTFAGTAARHVLHETPKRTLHSRPPVPVYQPCRVSHPGVGLHCDAARRAFHTQGWYRSNTSLPPHNAASRTYRVYTRDDTSAPTAPSHSPRTVARTTFTTSPTAARW